MYYKPSLTIPKRMCVLFTFQLLAFKLQCFVKLSFLTDFYHQPSFLVIANILKIIHHLYLIINYFLPKTQSHLNMTVWNISHMQNSKFKAEKNLENHP